MQKYLRYLRYVIPFINPEVRHWTWEARLLNWLTFIWLLVGLATLISASYSEGIINHQNGFYTIERQIVGVAIGFAGFNLITQIPLRRTFKFVPGMLLFCLLLIFVTVMVSPSINGAKRWIPIGSFLIQPSELIKPFLVVQSAYVFANWKQLDSSIRWAWLVIFGLVLGGILIQPNLSTTALCGIGLWLIAVAAELPWGYLISVSLGGVFSAVSSIYRNPYQLERIVSFVNPWQDAQGNGYQLVQSLLAIASGGVSGSGLGLSQQKLFYLPIRTTDFIFSVYAEEFGFIGCLFLLILIVSYGTVALTVALKCQNKRQRLIAIGVMVFLVGQSLLNIGVATGSLPTTGLPFPFLSYGTNSIIASLLLAALLIRVARESSQAKIIRF
ncbi:putative peptidoglycan glycosyltransferase FtsW [Hyella patelloides LEGE 07179]|uniref:Probable peptidoglycan glycosyltransferase FtsW n=1 Tax=Hyella patelloides LEGE 07179 TaxID=945734 RepID=A0A563VK25_9CYAN|nr:FtsW/RodA/SpoVE family cell cycle protein [Hyella patelloides]VEP11635.1 putative peptidoglycan glycosyltransferase FtsW [Hyella patelloides LEGE 07179]